MCGKSMFLIPFVLVLAMAAGSAHAQVAVAEELLVDLSAEDLAYGEGVATWPAHPIPVRLGGPGFCLSRKGVWR